MIGVVLNNRYEITAAIGKGAMGEVYRATDKQTGAEVAVKVLAGQFTFDADMVERFRREGEALQQLRHPNIVGIVDTFQHESRQAIVLEYVPGGSLHDLLKNKSPLDIPRVKQIALDLCDALIRAHRLNIIHRDIKPENVLMAQDGTPRLTDFGVARLVGDATRLTGTGTQIGTPYYMSPEAWEGEQLDAQSDIWSLGVMLYEMLSKQVPFGGETLVAVMNKVLNAPLPDLKALRPDVPDGLAEVIKRMLARDKAQRYQTIREASADLERGAPLDMTAAAAPAAKPAPPSPRRSVMRRFWIGAAATLAAFGMFFFGGLSLMARDTGGLPMRMGLIHPTLASAALAGADPKTHSQAAIEDVYREMEFIDLAPWPFDLMTPAAQDMLRRAESEYQAARQSFDAGNYQTADDHAETALKELSGVYGAEWAARLGAVGLVAAVLIGAAAFVVRHFAEKETLDRPNA